jgi:hypothetical protein
MMDVRRDARCASRGEGATDMAKKTKVEFESVPETETTPAEPVRKAATDWLYPNGGRPMCLSCRKQPIYLGGQCGDCWASNAPIPTR